MSLLTSTIEVAGRTLPKTSPCARPTSSQRLMSVTNIRVRTTCSGPAPTSRKASTTRRSASRACAPTSSPPTAPPPTAAAVVPATDTQEPTRTAREYPTTDSHTAPELTNCRCVIASSCPERPNGSRQRPLTGQPRRRPDDAPSARPSSRSPTGRRRGPVQPSCMDWRHVGVGSIGQSSAGARGDLTRRDARARAQAEGVGAHCPARG